MSVILLTLLDLLGGLLIIVGFIMFCFKPFWGIVLFGIGLGMCAVCNYLEEKRESRNTYSTSGSSHRSTSSYTGGYTDSYTDSYVSYDRKYHDELDAVQHAMHITEIYGDDWRGYDAEYSVHDPEAPGPDPETYTSTDL